MTSTSLTPEQERALRIGRAALELDATSTETHARRVMTLRLALQRITDAFPQVTS